MRKLLLATAAVLAVSGPAAADIVLSDLVFRDLGATGFGNAPRLLTLQGNVLESGGTIAGAGGTTTIFAGGAGTVVPQTICTTNGPQGCGFSGGGTVVEPDKTQVFSLAALGWTSGAAVGIGLDTSETNSGHALTFQSLTLTIYNNAGVALGSFSGDHPVDISQQLLADQSGNGNSVFDLRLDAAQQAQFNTLISGQNLSQLYEGLSASFGCGAFGPAVCNTALNFSSTDGPESFLAFNAVPGPVAGAGLPGLMAAMLGLYGLAKRRREKNGTWEMPA